MKPFQLAITTTTYFGTYDHVTDPNYRQRLWTLFLRSLKDSLVGIRTCLLVYDDASPSISNGSWPEFPTYISRQSKHVGNNQNIIDAMNWAHDMAEFCLYVDSDAYFAPNWHQTLNETMNAHPHAAGWPLYNSPHYAQYVVPRQDALCEKTHSGPFGLCYRTDARGKIGNGEWFEAFIGALPGKDKATFIGPRISVIQHTGRYGINNKPGLSEDFDPLFPHHFEAVESTQGETQHAR